MEDAREGAWDYSEAMCLLQAAEGAAMRRGFNQPRASLYKLWAYSCPSISYNFYQW